MKKGPLFESRLAAYFTKMLGVPVERRVTGGAKDRGDLSGLTNWTVEAKNVTISGLGAAMNEARREAVNAGTRYFVAILNRRSHDLERSYAVLELWELAELIADQLELARLRAAS